MKKRRFVLSALCIFLPLLIASAEQEDHLTENIMLRRIAEYWKEGEFSTVKTQVKAFLTQFPHSTYKESLYAMLGDLYFQEKNCANALKAYELISQEPFLTATEFNRLCCLYQEGLLQDVVHTALTFLKEGKGTKARENAARFQMADALFRLGRATDHCAAKEDLYTQALAHFQVLGQTEYKEHTLYPLAVIYSYLKEYERAASLFESLSVQHPERKEEFLFQAASLQLHVDKNAAIETYAQIYALQGKHAAEAAYNQLQLLFEQKRYRDLLLAQEKVLHHIPLEHLNMLRYYIGRSLVALHEYQPAIAHLVQLIDNEIEDKHLLKSVYLNLAMCAKETGNSPVFDRALRGLVTTFPHDQETARALLLHFQFCKETRELKQAQEDLLTLVTHFPEHAKKEAFQYDYALLCAQFHQWKEGAEAFKGFLSAFPNSAKRANAYRHLMVCQVEEANSASPEMAKIKREELLETLIVALGEKNLLSLEEKKQVRFLLGKTMYEIGLYKDALVELEDYVRDFPNDSSCPQAHLLMAYCHAKDPSDPLAFTLHAQEVLTHSKEVPPGLHLQLFNAYLLLAERAEVEEKSSLMDQAADHLFLSLDQPVKQENRLWLASHYFQRYRNSAQDNRQFYLTRAIEVLEHTLGLQGNTPHLSISAETVGIEAEVIKLSQLYSQAQRPSDAITLLNFLKKEYAHHPDFHWKYQRLALFELGELYEHTGDPAAALCIYDTLITTSTHAHSYFGTAARLLKARLEYAQLAHEHRQEESSSLQAIYDSLKDLEIQRRLVTEPWHWEAALTYIDIKTELAPEQEKTSIPLRLITHLLSQFSSSTEPAIQHYLSAAEQFPDQLAISQHYLQFLETEELRLKGLSHAGVERDDAIIQAKEQYETLLQQPLHDFLKRRVQQRIEELNIL